MFSIPDRIKNIIQDDEYELDRMGLSSSHVMLFRDKVLKIQDITEESVNEAEAFQWLKDKVSAPEILAYECKDGKSYLLMTKVPGQMACDPCYMEDPGRLTTLLAQALKQLWSVDITDCPLTWTLDRKLKIARQSIKDGLVDTENVEPGTYGENGFKDPEDLLKWLIEHKPEEELVLSHGDFCLPNIYIDDDAKIISYIDLGRAGISDKWQDIALYYRSLKHNYSGKYGGKSYPEYDPNLLFEKLGIVPDWKKLRYYVLLDELF